MMKLFDQSMGRFRNRNVIIAGLFLIGVPALWPLLGLDWLAQFLSWPFVVSCIMSRSFGMIVLGSPILAIFEVFYWKIVLKSIRDSRSLIRILIYAGLGAGGFLASLIDIDPPMFRGSRILACGAFICFLETLRCLHQPQTNSGGKHSKSTEPKEIAKGDKPGG